MPRVPRYQQQVNPAPLPTPSTRIDPGAAFQGGAAALQTAGKGLQQVAGAVGQAQERIARARDQANAALVLQLENQLSAEIDDVLFAENGGVMHASGMAAQDARQAGQERLEKTQAELLKKLSPETAKVFESRAGPALRSAYRRMLEHSSREVKSEMVTQARLRLNRGLQGISRGYSDPEVMEHELKSIESSAALTADTPAERQLAREQARAEGNSVAIRAALRDKNFAWAEERLIVAGDALPPDARADFKRRIDTAKADVAANAKTAEIILSSVDERTGWVDESKAWRQVDAAPPEERDALRQRVMQRIQEADRSRKAEVQTVYNRAFTDYIDKGGLRGISSEDKAWLTKRAPDVWREFQKMMEADAAAARAARERRDSASRLTDDKAIAESVIRNRILASPEEWAQRPEQDILTEAEKTGVTLLPSQVKALGAVLSEVKKKALESERRGKTVDEATWKRRVDVSVRSVGLKSEKEQAAAKAYLNESRDEWLLKNDWKEPPADEVSKWLNQAFTVVEDERILRDPKPAALVPKESRGSRRPAEEQVFAPVREIEESIRVNEQAWQAEERDYLDSQVGSLDAPAEADRMPDPQREAAREYLKSRGLQGTEQEVDALLSAAAP